MGIVGGGPYAQYARPDSRMETVIPSAMPFTDAATVMESFVTAGEALANLGRIAARETVLVHAAAGGNGSAAVQLAKFQGARVPATACGNNIENVLAPDTDTVLDYRQTNFEAEIVDVTGSRGVDLIIDFVGGSYLSCNIRSLTPGGRLVPVGLLGRHDNAIVPLGTVLHNHLQLLGTVMKSRSRAEKRAMLQRLRDQILPIMGTELQPVVGAIYPFSVASNAHRRMEAGSVFGKIVLGDFHP